MERAPSIAGAVIAYVGLGANLGDPAETIRQALRDLEALPHTELSGASSLYRSAPLGFEAQPPFINAVARLSTRLSARALLDGLLALEARAGRRRSFANAPRTLDLDLLLYDELRLDEPGLCVPHPRMHQRRFVLEPLIELEPACVIPGRGPARDALAEVRDQSVAKLEPQGGP
jgi:2-amino-4-hydroxy-6-hydroxymethyldihydropteridine diphosphokinase